MTGSNQKGEIRIGLIVGLIVVVGVIYFAAQMVPVMYHSYAFQAAVEDIAMEAAGQRARHDDFEKIRAKVLREADEHGVKDDILRTARQRNVEPVYIDRTNTDLIIQVRYVKPVDLVLTTWNWKVDVNEKRTLY